MTKLQIDLTSDDIRSGDRENCENCPIARAASRAFEAHHSLMGISVNSYYIDFAYDDGAEIQRRFAPLPEAASKFILDFDQPRRDWDEDDDVRFDAFSFTVELHTRASYRDAGLRGWECV